MNVNPDREKKIRMVLNSLMITEEEANELLDLAKGNVEEVSKFIPFVLKQILYLYGKINTRSKDQKPMYGIFLFVANGEKGERLFLDAIFSSREDVSQNVDLKEIRPLVIEKEISYMRSRVDFTVDSNASKNFSLFSDFLSSPSNIYKLYNLTRKEDLNSVKQILETAFSKWNDFSIAVDLKAECSTQFSYENFKKGMLPADEGKEKREEKEEANLWLKCAPVVDPVKGKTLQELRVGDSVMVKINDDREFSRFIVDALKSIRVMKDNELSAVIVSVEGTQADNLLVSVELARGIFGKMVVAEGVKIAAGNARVEHKKEAKSTSFMWRVTFFAIASGIGALIILVIFLLIK